MELEGVSHEYSMVVNHSVVLEISLRFDSFWHTFFSPFLSFSFLMSSATHSVEFVMNDPQAVRHGFLPLSDSRAQFLIDRVLVSSLSPTAPRRAVFLLDAADSLLYLRMFWTRAAHTWLKSCTHRRSTIRLQIAAHPVLSFSFYGDISSLFLATFSPLHVLQSLLHFLVSNAINRTAFLIRFQTRVEQLSFFRALPVGWSRCECVQHHVHLPMVFHTANLSYTIPL